jgi:group II intron reverse transcriptase/maturase
MLTDTTTRRLETLGTLSKEGKRINGLFRLMETPHLWWQAYANIHGNRGAATPGSDGSSLDGFSVGRLLRIIATLKSGTYRFNPVRRVHIPKSNGKTRPLGIPSGDDKLVQEVTRMLLEKIYEPVFSDDSHGFRNGRSCHTALMKVKQKWTGMKWIVNMDIKGYFDNIDHDVMVNILARRIDDPRFLALIRSMLKAGYIEDWRFHDTYSGTPQGGVVSPILANIYLHELDEFVASMRAKFEHGSRRAENREYKNLCETIKRRMKQVDALKLSGDQPALEAKMREIAALDQQRKKLRSSDPMDANYRRLVYIRYADDFLLGVIGTHADAISIMQQVAIYIGDELRLEIAEDKSGVVHATEGVRFLGYDVRTYTGNRVVRTTRSGRHTTTRSVSERMQLHIPQDKLRKFCGGKGYGVYDTFDPIHRNSLIHLSELEIVQTYNAEMRGLANFYCLATNAKRDLNKLHGIWHGSLLKTLAAKRRSTVNKVARSLRRGENSALVITGNGEDHAFPLYSLKMMRMQPITFQSIDLPPRTWHFTLSHTELFQRMAARECEYCGNTDGPFEVHHIRKLADVAKGKQLWQLTMARRQRKTLVMCVPCHQRLHAGTL